MTSTSLQRLLDPQSIAIVGLSSDPTKHGRRVLGHLQRHGYPGEIWGVNPKLPSIEGVAIFRSIGELPAPPDVLVLTVPAPSVPDIVAEAHGVGVAIVFAGGFAEAGPTGVALQERLAAAQATSGVRMLGPNSGGVIQPGRPISFLTCLDRPVDELRSGPVGLVTQSGGTGSYLHNLAAAKGSGFAASISTGNEVDLDIANAVMALASQTEVKVIAVIMETIRNGPAFIDAVHYAHEQAKRVVAARFGTSDHGRSMLQTHTAALAHPERVLDGVLQSLGVPTAETPEELLDVAEILARVETRHAETVGIVTHSGGVAILLADLCDRYGVQLVPPSDGLVAAVSPLLEQGSVGNPLDIGGIIGGPHRFAEVVGRFAEEYDAVLAVSSAHPPAHSDERVASMLALETDTPIVHLWMAGDVAAHALTTLRLSNAPVTDEPRAAIRALRATATVPAPRPPPQDIATAHGDVELPMSEYAAKQLIAQWGVPTTPGALAGSVEDAVAIADGLGYPVAVKVSAVGLTHKTDVGGVAIDLASPKEVAHACETVIAGASKAGFGVDGVLVEAMAIGPEVIAAALRNETFGPMVLVGLGGILAEAKDNAVMALAPLPVDDAHRLIARTPGLQAITSPRRGEAADLETLAGILASLGDRLVINPSLDAIEINPLTWTSEGWQAVDAVIL